MNYLQPVIASSEAEGGANFYTIAAANPGLGQFFKSPMAPQPVSASARAVKAEQNYERINPL